MSIAQRAWRVSRRLVFGPPVVAPPPTQVYSIGIYAGRSPTSVAPWPGVANPVLTRDQVTDAPAALVADPFMIRNGGRWYMFFEVLNVSSGRGEIGLATSDDGLAWQYQRIVLREPFHLSYPYVFRWNGTFYMVPETYQAGTVRLYRAVAFPTVWAFEQTLIDGDEFVDPNPFHVNGRWWLLTGGGASPIKSETLRLHSAPDLRGPWLEHPRSPIHADDPLVARPAGRVVISGRRIVRYAQECVPEYGLRVRAFDITELSETTYREKPADTRPILDGSGFGWNAGGMHHIDVQALDPTGWIACVDGWHWEPHAS